jgi:AcrR family transcriptional regulator
MTVMVEAKEKDTRQRIVETAERLFRQLGFQKTTVADIARELGMSSANVYRFFGAKSEINESVCRLLMSEVEQAAEAIAAEPGSASDRLRKLVHTVNQMSGERYIDDRKLHEMVAVALSDNWPIVLTHIEHMGAVYGKIIADGVAKGEFEPCDIETAAKLVHTATIRFCHPRLMVECADGPSPTLDEMVTFCLKALSK